MTKPGNSNARKGQANRVKWSGWLDPATVKLIKYLQSQGYGKSQSEVIDKAIGLTSEVEQEIKIDQLAKEQTPND